MKKSLLALTISSFVLSSASGAVFYNNEYGTSLSISGSLRLLLAKQSKARVDLLNDQSRLWLNVNQNVGDSGWQFFAAAQIRPQTKYDDNFSSGIYVHRLFGGIKHKDYGEINFGNTYTVANYFKLADFGYKFGGVDRSGVLSPGIDQDTDYLGTYRTYGRTQYGMRTSAPKAIYFTTGKWQGLSFAGSYIFTKYAELQSPLGKTNYRQDGYQLGLFFDRSFGEVTVKTNLVYGYAINGFIYPNKKNNNNFFSRYVSRSYGAAFGLEWRDITFGIDYLADNSKGGDNHNFKNNYQYALQVGLKYQITDPWDIYGMYRQTRYMNADYVGKDKPKDFYYVHNKGWALGTTYRLSRRVLTFFEFDTNNPDGDKKYPFRQFGYYVGMRINF